MSEENTATVVRAFLEGILSGQVEQAISNYFASDGVVENPLPEPIPFGGIYHGPDGVRKCVTRGSRLCGRRGTRHRRGRPSAP